MPTEHREGTNKLVGLPEKNVKWFAVYFIKFSSQHTCTKRYADHMHAHTRVCAHTRSHVRTHTHIHTFESYTISFYWGECFLYSGRVWYETTTEIVRLSSTQTTHNWYWYTWQESLQSPLGHWCTCKHIRMLYSLCHQLPPIVRTYLKTCLTQAASSGPIPSPGIRVTV